MLIFPEKYRIRCHEECITYNDDDDDQRVQRHTQINIKKHCYSLLSLVSTIEHSSASMSAIILVAKSVISFKVRATNAKPTT